LSVPVTFIISLPPSLDVSSFFIRIGNVENEEIKKTTKKTTKKTYEVAKEVEKIPSSWRVQPLRRRRR